MATSTVSAEQIPEVFPWLKTLPLAPEYHPTLAEFQDPIAYIFKIEKEASKYGICKIVPPVPPSPKKTAIANLNRSLAARNGSTNPKSSPTFTTRQQQIGFCPRKQRPVQRPVWQSGEYYTFQEFEAKAKSFEKSYLKKSAKKGLSPLEIETLFWTASVDKPFSVEYANDMPGSAFVPVSSKKCGEAGEAVTLGETAWNMRGVSRANGSLLKFMKEEIPGVTSPMVYIAMMFSWFAWHVEDHDLHSLNYLHMGAGKTWYGVPREAAVAFEEVVRVHGYGGEINPLVTFSTLGEKTTVMSPEVFIKAGIPCCRLVQNPGEFVVTFPRAYHSGFSHGFNCGEAANIATPGWLTVAKEAAIRRASINYPPMVSHFQLLYDLALSLCSRIPMRVSAEPRSSRLKDKKKGEGETVVKGLFVQNVMQNNDLLHNLGKGCSVVIIPQSSSHIFACSNLSVRSQLKVKPRLSLGLCNQEEAIKASENLASGRIILEKKGEVKQLKGYYSVKGKFSSSYENYGFHSLIGNSDAHANTSQTRSSNYEIDVTVQGDRLSDQRLFSCVTCGILSFDCVAIVQPREASARYLMSADCSLFNDWIVGSGVTTDEVPASCTDANNSDLNSSSGRMEKRLADGLYDVPIQTSDYQIPEAHQSNGVVSETEAPGDATALGLLALTYGNSSDSDEDQAEPDIPKYTDQISGRTCSSDSRYQCDYFSLSSLKQDYHGGLSEDHCHSSLRLGGEDEVPIQIDDSYVENGRGRANFMNGSYRNDDCSFQFQTDHFASLESNGLEGAFRDVRDTNTMSKLGNAIVPVENANMSFAPKSDEDSSRMHVFCLEHAVEVEQQLRPIGGANILLLCHQDYPRVEAEAKLVAEELGFDHIWNDIPFRDATKEDEEWIQSALNSEEAVPGNGDWAVKLGINLYYSAILSRCPLYSKQMPYNSVIYNAFGRESPRSSPSEPKVYGRGLGRQKKIVVAGKWCGKVWMSNQVHPLLVPKDTDEHEQEDERSFQGRSKPDDKPERKSESTCKAEATSSTSKAGRKRKLIVYTRSIKKARCVKIEDRDRDTDDLPDCCPPRRQRSMKKARCTETEDGNRDSDESAEDCLPQWYGRSIKKSKSPEVEDSVRDSDDLAGNSPRQLIRKILKSKFTKKETPKLRNKFKQNSRMFDSTVEDEGEGGPSTRLRNRNSKPSKENEAKPVLKKQTSGKKVKKTRAVKSSTSYNVAKMKHEDTAKSKKMKVEEADYQCDVEGCVMSFGTKQELVLHKRNICPVKGCGKKFFSHKYLVQHRRVHSEDRPLKCPWKGCKMTFKWAWARTEHVRVHTGARPYVCAECGQTFRFVSDFSRHKRKTGHLTKKVKGK